MRIPLGPLNEAETLKLTGLLEHVAGRSLVFARGLFAAAASAPVLLDPTEWMPLLLTQAPPDRTSLERLFELLIREYNACAECLSLGVPVVPHPGAAEEITEFCRGYVQLMQSVTRWTRDADAFPLSVPFAVMAGYVGPEVLKSSDPSAEQDFDAWRVRRSKSLPDDVAELFGYWAEARKKAAPEVKEKAPPAVEKIGRNDACPCGSGKKYKKCCAS